MLQVILHRARGRALSLAGLFIATGLMTSPASALDQINMALPAHRATSAASSPSRRAITGMKGSR